MTPLFKNRMRQFDYTERDLCRVLDRGRNYVIDRLNGKSDFLWSEVKAICELLDVEINRFDDLLRQ